MVSGVRVFRTPGGADVRVLVGHWKGGVVVSAQDLVAALGVSWDGAIPAIKQIQRGIWQAKFEPAARRGESSFNEEAAYAYLHFERRVAVSQRSALRRWLAAEVFPAAIPSLSVSPSLYLPVEASVSPVPNFSVNTFSFEGAPVRTVEIGGAPWFVAKDVAERLGYAETSNAARLFAHVPDDWRGVNPIHTPGGTQPMLCLSEHGLYFFLARSDKPAALPFQRWIAGEVLPAIRKTGAYKMEPLDPIYRVGDLEMRVPRSMSEALRSMAILADKVEEQATKIQEDAPKVEFAMAVRNCDDTLSVGKFAKILGVGEVKFYRWLREAQILFKQGKANIPFQRYLELGYFRVVENVIYMGSAIGNVPVPQTLVTGKGQIWLQRKWAAARGVA